MQLGDKVTHNGKPGRIWAFHGQENEVIVRYDDGEQSKWIPITTVKPRS